MREPGEVFGHRMTYLKPVSYTHLNIHPMPHMISSNIPASRQNLILTCRRPLIHQQNRVVILCKFPFLDIFVILNISCIYRKTSELIAEFKKSGMRSDYDAAYIQYDENVQKGKFTEYDNTILLVDERPATGQYEILPGGDVYKRQVLSNSGGVGEQNMSYEEIVAAVEVGKMHNRVVSCHAHGTSGILAAAKAGVTSIEHCTMVDDEGIEYMLCLLYTSTSVLKVKTNRVFVQVQRTTGVLTAKQAKQISRLHLISCTGV